MVIKVNGFHLWYEKKGSGAPIILLHGNGESHDIFAELTNALSVSHTVYAVDSRDHGGSEKTDAISYDLIKNDIAQFIEALDLREPIVLGFSDGGIVGLLLASENPSLLSKLVVCGANSNPGGIKNTWKSLFRLQYICTRDKKIKLMLTQPQITAQMLERITIPVLVLAGEHDMIKESDTRFIASGIRGAQLKIIENESHSSYVADNEKLLKIIQTFM